MHFTLVLLFFHSITYPMWSVNLLGFSFKSWGYGIPGNNFILAPISQTIFFLNFILLSSKLYLNDRYEILHRHDSCAVLACAKFCNHMIHYNGNIVTSIFQRIGITMEKLFMKWAQFSPNFCIVISFRNKNIHVSYTTGHEYPQEYNWCRVP